MTVRVIQGDCRAVLATLPADSVHCVVTSPPYWGLRDYGIGKDAHGLEPTIDLYVRNAVEIFRAVHHVLRPDGSLWLNLGDSYNNFRNGQCGQSVHNHEERNKPIDRKRGSAGLKEKDLCGVPWRIAFALQADGWWLRQDIIWNKPNPMPESVTDRCTKAHEYLFLLTKSARYFFDAEAIKEAADARNEHDATGAGYEAPGQKPHSGNRVELAKGFRGGSYVGGRPGPRKETGNTYAPDGYKRNKRSVWIVATAPFPEAHFATFPPELIEPCIKAGTSERGCCAKCGAPWEREITVDYKKNRPSAGDDPRSRGKDRLASARESYGSQGWRGNNLLRDAKILGWRATCKCAAAVVPCTVLDPFGGAGTTGLVADRLQRNAILIELNPAYAEMARKRIFNDAPLFAEAAE